MRFELKVLGTRDVVISWFAFWLFSVVFSAGTALALGGGVAAFRGPGSAQILWTLALGPLIEATAVIGFIVWLFEKH